MGPFQHILQFAHVARKAVATELFLGVLAESGRGLAGFLRHQPIPVVRAQAPAEVPSSGAPRGEALRSGKGSASTASRTLGQVRLAAVPAAAFGEGFLARQVYAAVGAADHGLGGVGATLVDGRGGGAHQSAPEPDDGNDDEDPEQQTKQAHEVL